MDKYIGTLLGGRYEILEVIGVGGMAIVYKAKCRVLNRFVAIKMLKDEFLQDEEFRRRFYNESQAVAKLSHNNIVSVYDVARTEKQDYIVMELIDGITLKDYLRKKGHLSWQETVFFTQQIARALSHAHSRGIIHQDIKPQNIMLLRDGTAKVTDFGIAKLESNQETRVVREAIGSVHYIAPEQAKGGSIDARADIYSLGVVMYEMLTGKLPFEGDSAVAIVMQHINSVPVLPSKLVSGIPQGLDSVVMHAMCPNVSLRYATAQELCNDLERIKQNPNTLFTYGARDGRGQPNPFDDTRTISDDNKYQSPPPRNEQPYQQPYEQHNRQEVEYAPRRQPAQRHQRQPERRYRNEDKKESSSPMLIAGIIVVIVAIIALIAGGAILMGGGSDDTLKVPNFIGMDIDDIMSKIDTEYEDFYIVEASEKVDDPKYDEGEVVKQSPDADTEVKKGAKITLTVAGASEDEEEEEGYELIDFSEMELAEVERLLMQNDLQDSYEIVEQPSDDVEKGYVIRTSPSKGTVVTKDDKITIYVSTGAEKEFVKVPDVTGMTLEKAKALLASYSLEVGETINQESDKPVGQVFNQSVKANTEVEEGTKINLYISLGKTEQEQPSTGGNTDEPSENNTVSEQGTASISVALPDSDSCHVVIYLGSQKLAEKTFSPAGGTQVIEVSAPKGEQKLDIYIDGVKTSNTYTFN